MTGSLTFYVVFGLLAWAMVIILTFALMLRQERQRQQRERELIDRAMEDWQTSLSFGKRLRGL